MFTKYLCNHILLVKYEIIVDTFCAIYNYFKCTKLFLPLYDTLFQV